MRRITAQSYNNKLQVISTFLQYLQVTDYIGEFSNPIPLYYKKSYPGVNEIDNLDQKLNLLIAHLGEFPENLRIMSLILLTTGIKKGQLFLLRNADFYYKDENSWMKVPDTTRSIPIPDILHWLVLRYSDRNHILQFASGSGHWCVCQRPPGGTQRPPSLRYFDRLNDDNVVLCCPLHNSIG